MLLSAFILGLFSSFHCLGMCGPIAMAVPHPSGGIRAMLPNKLLYNGGRAVTYMIMGLVVGLFGEGISLAGYQQGLSILMGGLILLLLLSTNQWETKIAKLPIIHPLMLQLRKSLAPLLRNPNPGAAFNIGILNGFLPCGFVYLALAGAMATGDVYLGMGYMGVFALGTFPAMVGISLVGAVMKPASRNRMSQVFHVFAFAFAILLILRGLNLGIPFVSPVLDVVEEAAVCG